MSVRQSVQAVARRYNPALSLWRRRLQMPSKKPNKAAKKPGKATPKKAARKVAVAKKAARPAPAPKPTLSKVPVKPHKPKPAAAKPAAASTNHVAHPARVKPPVVADAHMDHAPASEKSPPIKFDSRPLVLPTRSAPSDEEADGESGGSANLLAGPRNVK